MYSALELKSRIYYNYEDIISYGYRAYRKFTLSNFF